MLQSLLNPGQISQPLYLSLQALAESLERDFAQGHDCTDGFDEMQTEVDRLMDASPWTMHPDHRCVHKADVGQLTMQDVAEAADRELIESFLPPWATGTTKAWTDLGAQLRTRDGRRIGNAVVIGHEEQHGLPFYAVVTDVGTKVYFSERELEVLFHQPLYTMDITSHAGVRKLLGLPQLPLDSERQAISADEWTETCNRRDIDVESQRNLMWRFIEQAGLTATLKQVLDLRHPQ